MNNRGEIIIEYKFMKEDIDTFVVSKELAEKIIFLEKDLV